MANIKQLNSTLLGEQKEEGDFVTFILIFAIVIMLGVISFVSFFQTCKVIGVSMTNTLDDGDFLLVTKYETKLKYNDIIIVDAVSDGSTTRLVKRVIATQGETFKFSYYNSYICLYKKINGNFEQVNEGYIKEGMKNIGFGDNILLDTEYTVPQNCIFFLGDNRNDSRDSRYYGFVDKSAVLGKVVYKIEENTFQDFILDLIFHYKSKSVEY